MKITLHHPSWGYFDEAKGIHQKSFGGIQINVEILPRVGDILSFGRIEIDNDEIKVGAGIIGGTTGGVRLRGQFRVLEVVHFFLDSQDDEPDYDLYLAKLHETEEMTLSGQVNHLTRLYGPKP